MEYSQSLITGKGVHISEALSMGGETTVIGLGIVFAVLAILMIVLMLFKVFFYKDPAKTVAQEPAKAEPTHAPEAAQETAEEEDEEELIAVLTAAVAASMNTSTYNLRIKSYRRVPNTRPAWNRAGISETIGNRF